MKYKNNNRHGRGDDRGGHGGGIVLYRCGHGDKW